MKNILYLLLVFIHVELDEPTQIYIQAEGRQYQPFRRSELQTIIRALMHEYLKEEGM